MSFVPQPKREHWSTAEALVLIRRQIDQAYKDQETQGLSFALVSAEDIDAIICRVDPEELRPVDFPDLSPDEGTRSDLWFRMDPRNGIPQPPVKQRHRALPEVKRARRR